MASLTSLDLASRTMAGKKTGWVKAATSENKGAFRKKAEAAGETTREYAREKADAPGKLGQQARLASTLMHLGKKRRSPLYNARKDD